MDDYRVSEYLFRTTLARFEFDGTPRLHFDSRFGPVEHHLLEVHEHNHWALAHSTSFGIAQLSLAYALMLAQSEEQKARYRECLCITTELSREVYEGCAVYHEMAVARSHQVPVDAQWFAPLEGTVYGHAHALFDVFLCELPFGEALKQSIASNVAELILNSTPRFLSLPSRLAPRELEQKASNPSPNMLLDAVSGYLSRNAHAFAQTIRDQVIKPTAEGLNVMTSDLLFDEIAELIDSKISGQASYRTYVAIRDLLLAGKLPIFPGPPEAVDLARYDIWLTWVRGLPGHERFYPNLVRDTAPVSLRSEPDLGSERYDFDTFRTSFRSPGGVDTDDIALQAWQPLRRAATASNSSALRLYVSFGDGTDGDPIQEVLRTTPLAAFIDGGSSLDFGSTLTVSMSVEDGKRRFDEVNTRPAHTSLVVRAGRSALRPHAEYNWRQLGARYRLSVPELQWGSIPAELAGLGKAAAVQRRNFDMAGFTLFGMACEDLDCTLGVLLEESSAFGWVQALKEVVRAGLSAHLHSIRVGGPSGYWLTVALLRRRGSSTPVFLYSPASMHAIIRLRSMTDGSRTDLEGVDWVESLTGLGEPVSHLESISLICEHLMLRGF